LTVEVVELEGLAWGKEVFLAPVALQGQGDGGFLMLAGVVTQAGELVGVRQAVEGFGFFGRRISGGIPCTLEHFVDGYVIV
jgi:hypothetical protein